MTLPPELAALFMQWPLYINDSGAVSCRGACCGEDPWTPAGEGRRTTLQGLVDGLAAHIADSLTAVAEGRRQ